MAFPSFYSLFPPLQSSVSGLSETVQQHEKHTVVDITVEWSGTALSQVLGRFEQLHQSPHGSKIPLMFKKQGF